MASILFDAVTVNVSLADKVAAAPSLDIAMVFAPEVTEITDEITNLTQAFVSDDDLKAIFVNTTKVYKCGTAHYTQPDNN